MPILGFLKTTSMQNTYLRLINLQIDVRAPSISFIVNVYEDDTESVLLDTLSYYIDNNDPHWNAVLNFLQAQRPVWEDAIESYLLLRPEFEDAVQEVQQ